MEVAVLQHKLHVHLDDQPRQLFYVESFPDTALEIGHLDAVDVFHRQYPFARALPDHAGNHDVRPVRKQPRDRLHALSLVQHVDLERDVRSQLLECGLEREGIK